MVGDGANKKKPHFELGGLLKKRRSLNQGEMGRKKALREGAGKMR